MYGLGRSGRGVLRFLAGRGLSAEWADARPSDEDLALAQQLGFARAGMLTGYRTVIAAPGVPIDHPDLLALHAQGAEIMGEVELAWRAYPHLPMVGITGTAGKGGTTVLVAELLRASGLQAREGGNIDPPLLDVIEGAQAVVIELSSFQLERIIHFRPQVAVITNLGVDHLDRHRTPAAYHAAKLNITRNQTESDVLLLPEALTAKVPTRAQRRTFSPQFLCLSTGEQVLSPADLPAGIHPANAAAALLATEALLTSLGQQVDAAVLAHTLRAAQPVRGRFETVARYKDVHFINDSIATRTVAVEAALEHAAGPIAWLVGGRDKGADLAPLRALAQHKVRRVIAFGEDGPTLAQALGLPYQVIAYQPKADPMPQAIRAAWQVLSNDQPSPDQPSADPTGTVLLAPIGTSFDLYRDYAQRGEAFSQAARLLCAELEGGPQ